MYKLVSLHVRLLNECVHAGDKFVEYYHCAELICFYLIYYFV